jgi:hypothetical protein
MHAHNSWMDWTQFEKREYQLVDENENEMSNVWGRVRIIENNSDLRNRIIAKILCKNCIEMKLKLSFPQFR